MKENNVYKGGYTLSTGITKETQGNGKTFYPETSERTL